MLKLRKRCDLNSLGIFSLGILFPGKRKGFSEKKSRKSYESESRVKVSQKPGGSFKS